MCSVTMPNLVTPMKNAYADAYIEHREAVNAERMAGNRKRFVKIKRSANSNP